jgi:hypothetical protein
MKTIGYEKPLYILPFDHRGSFEAKMFGWHGDLTAAQTAEIAAAKQANIADSFQEPRCEAQLGSVRGCICGWHASCRNGFRGQAGRQAELNSSAFLQNTWD